jgi:methionyl-tRNA synthetase
LVNKNNKTITATQLTNTIDNCEEERKGTALDKYIKNICVMNKRTAHEYYLRLTSFQDFVISRYKAKTKTKNEIEARTTLDDIITRINERSEDPYEILNDYVAYGYCDGFKAGWEKTVVDGLD